MSKMNLPVIFKPGGKDHGTRHKFHLFKLHANENLNEWDAWSVFVTTDIPVSQHLLQDTLSQSEMSRTRDVLNRMNPQFLSTTSVVDFFCATCEAKCFASEQTLAFAGRYDEFQICSRNQSMKKKRDAKKHTIRSHDPTLKLTCAALSPINGECLDRRGQTP